MFAAWYPKFAKSSLHYSAKETITFGGKVSQTLTQDFYKQEIKCFTVTAEFFKLDIIPMYGFYEVKQILQVFFSYYFHLDYLVP